MTARHDIPELNAKGLREFALTTGAILAVLFGLFFPWLLERALPAWPWIIGGGLALWGLAAPRSLRPVYRGWMRFGLVMNRIMTPLILGIVYFLVITPTGAVMRIFGRDPMARHFDAKVRSYRVASRKAPREKMEKPF